MLNSELSKIVEQVQQVLYMKSQIKQGNPVEYYLPSAISDAMIKT
jgi:hypothetical protein